VTDQTMRAVSAPQFSIGNVLGTSFSVLARNIIPFLLITVVISIPYFLVSQLAPGSAPPAQSSADQGHVYYFYYANISSGADWLSLILHVTTVGLVSAALAYGTFQDLRGQKVPTSELVKRGFASLLPVVLAAVAFTILLFVGLILLVIPGLIVATALWVYVPAIVVEKVGVGDAFKRSRALTKGQRWNILGLYIIVFIAALIVEAIESIVLGIPIAALAHHWAIIPIQLCYMIFVAVMSAVGYYYLRADKEGVAIDEITKVFD
jgi:hypothetical protein